MYPTTPGGVHVLPGPPIAPIPSLFKFPLQRQHYSSYCRPHRGSNTEREYNEDYNRQEPLRWLHELYPTVKCFIKKSEQLCLSALTPNPLRMKLNVVGVAHTSI